MPPDLRVVPGMLLAAMPDLMDPHFMHAVVLLCQHADEGAYGLIVNKPANLALRQLLPEHPLLARSDFPVHVGGPVDHQTLQFVHVVPQAIPGGLCLDGTLWLGGELEAMARYVTEEPQKARASLRLFLGYAGWGAGQLDAELGIGSWLPAPPSLGAVFGPEGEANWRRVVRSVGDEGRDLENLPPDVSWN
jgi:putative transcriptional regulator